MKIYTSYFGNLKALHKADIEPIAVARWLPKWYFGQSYKLVAPTPFMLSDKCDRETYIRMYNDILKKIDPKQLIVNLKMLSKGKDIALLCYEKPGDFCHRHLLAEWMSVHTEYIVEEYEEEKKKEVVELSLFD